ncbi:D-alanine--poly(phosphoribitol) ligase, partial [Staphylococcus aureus]
TEAKVAVTSIQFTEEILDQYATVHVDVERPGARLSTTDEGELAIVGQSVRLGDLKNDQIKAEVCNFDDGICTY